MRLWITRDGDSVGEMMGWEHKPKHKSLTKEWVGEGPFWEVRLELLRTILPRELERGEIMEIETRKAIEVGGGMT